MQNNSKLISSFFFSFTLKKHSSTRLHYQGIQTLCDCKQKEAKIEQLRVLSDLHMHKNKQNIQSNPKKKDSFQIKPKLTERKAQAHKKRPSKPE